MKAIFDSMVRTAVLTVGIVSMGLVCAGCKTAGEDLQGLQVSLYPVVYAKVPPVIDGKLDDAIWREATPHKKFYVYENKNKPVEIGTAYLAWDRENLYYAMHIQDKDLYVTQREDNTILCRADVAEIFIKPRDDMPDLYEFEFNMWEALWDIHYPGLGGGGGADRYTKNFNSGATVKSTHDGTINNWRDVDKGWTVEVAIPLKAFARVAPNGPKPGDTWKFNVAGYDFNRYRKETLLFTTVDNNFNGFAEHKKYPRMQFMAPTKGTK